MLKSVSAETIKLQVTEDELWHLATDIACLRASNFRAIDTATAREDDVRRARDELVALIRRNPTHR